MTSIPKSHFPNKNGEPVKLAVEALCRRDTNLHTADAILQFMITKLEGQDSTVAAQLAAALTRRIQQRRTNYSGMLKFLHTGKHESVPKNQDNPFGMPSISSIANNVRDLIQRLHEIPPR